MAIISSDVITEEIRRKTIRELADISSATFDNDELDARIENADQISKTYFNANSELTGEEDYFRNLITVSNLITSVLIRQGLGGGDNIAVAKDQTVMYRSIVNAQNKKEPEQGQEIMTKTAGINNRAGTFG